MDAYLSVNMSRYANKNTNGHADVNIMLLLKSYSVTLTICASVTQPLEDRS